jgi:hypothetical protein
MSGFFRFLAFLLALGLLAAIGIGIYNAGVSAGLGSDAGLPPYVGQPWDMGWIGGILAFIFGVFFLFLIVGLIFGLFRAAFGWGHHGRGNGWGEYRYKYRAHGGHHDRERDYFEAWHRELHGETPETPDSQPNGAPSKPATDQA